MNILRFENGVTAKKKKTTKTVGQTVDSHPSKCFSLVLWERWNYGVALRRQKLTLDARITEPLIGPSEISQGDGEHRETSRFLPAKSPLMLRDE